MKKCHGSETDYGRQRRETSKKPQVNGVRYDTWRESLHRRGGVVPAAVGSRAEPARLSIFLALQDGERRITDLAAELDGSQATISSHIASLKRLRPDHRPPIVGPRARRPPPVGRSALRSPRDSASRSPARAPSRTAARGLFGIMLCSTQSCSVVATYGRCFP